MSVLQMAGTLVGIPVALASGYSVYHSNFSPEATCQSLRTNIIAMLDKSADASTLRTLVRRDVAAFEQNCTTVDPDAVAAFKILLTAKAVPPVAKTAPPPQAEVKSAAREPAQRAEAAKQPAAAKPVIVENPAAPRDKEASDANWLAAVRGALVSHDQPAQTDVAVAPPPVAPPPVAPALRETHVVAPPAAPSMPALPPAQPVASAPAPAADDHPVPPGTIPDGAPVQKPAEKTSEHSWRAKIPLVNRVIGD
jgi:hypothetical protein